VDRQYLADNGYEDSIVLDPPFLDAAIDGISHNGRVIYDYVKLVEAYAENSEMSMEEAAEFVDYNTIRSLDYIENGPIVKYTI
jgi:hypothetical protein